jgi:hypothetical protein
MTEFNTDNLIQGNFGESEGSIEYGQLNNWLSFQI